MYIIREDNINEVLEALFIGYSHAGYTSECVSSNKVSRYLAFEKTIDKLIEDIIQMGYCPKALCKDAEGRAGIDLGIHCFKSLKKVTDDYFEIYVAKPPVDIGRGYMMSK